jgi:hypothetical protein
MAEKIRLVTLENLEPRLACYNLDHDHAVVRRFPQVAELADGTAHGHFVDKALPDSVTFLAREIKTLPASILECDEIKSALLPMTPGVKPRLRRRGDILEPGDRNATVPIRTEQGTQDAPSEVVNTTAKKARDAARSVIGSQATVEKGQG